LGQQRAETRDQEAKRLNNEVNEVAEEADEFDEGVATVKAAARRCCTLWARISSVAGPKGWYFFWTLGQWV
jgi:hypothetical protein